MSALENVLRLVKEWQAEALSTELEYRDSLVAFLRSRLKDSRIETEYRHNGTTVDIYIRQSGFLRSTQVFVELKRNLLHKAQLDRLVGQITAIGLGNSTILVVLCGKTKQELVARLKDTYRFASLPAGMFSDARIAVVVKETAGKATKSG